MDKPAFEKFPSIPRLARGMVITEKIDGTNAQVAFNEEGDMIACSRNRIITPDDDNYGFAAWAYTHRGSLFKLLGKGRHFGEWWGSGIQRKYGLTESDKRFSLFNTKRWTQDDPEKLKTIPRLGVVPILYEGNFDSQAIDDTMWQLEHHGSYASEGFMKPEGIIVYQIAARQMYKRTFEYDEKGKPE